MNKEYIRFLVAELRKHGFVHAVYLPKENKIQINPDPSQLDLIKKALEYRLESDDSISTGDSDKTRELASGLDFIVEYFESGDDEN